MSCDIKQGHKGRLVEWHQSLPASKHKTGKLMSSWLASTFKIRMRGLYVGKGRKKTQTYNKQSILRQLIPHTIFGKRGEKIGPNSLSVKEFLWQPPESPPSYDPEPRRRGSHRSATYHVCLDVLSWGWRWPSTWTLCNVNGEWNPHLVVEADVDKVSVLQTSGL